VRCGAGIFWNAAERKTARKFLDVESAIWARGWESLMPPTLRPRRRPKLFAKELAAVAENGERAVGIDEEENGSEQTEMNCWRRKNAGKIDPERKSGDFPRRRTWTATTSRRRSALKAGWSDAPQTQLPTMNLYCSAGERDDREAAHSYQRRSCEQLVGLDFRESDGFGEFCSGGQLHLWVF